MRFVFADTLYFVARLHLRDQWHARAKEVMASLASVGIVTTESVLIELLNFFAASQPEMRRTVAEFVQDTLDAPEIEVIPHTREAFLSGLALYETRPDKGYSLTDCISMTVMRERNISDVLTHDNHFRQKVSKS